MEAARIRGGHTACTVLRVYQSRTTHTASRQPLGSSKRHANSITFRVTPTLTLFDSTSVDQRTCWWLSNVPGIFFWAVVMYDHRHRCCVLLRWIWIMCCVEDVQARDLQDLRLDLYIFIEQHMNWFYTIVIDRALTPNLYGPSSSITIWYLL